MSNATSRQRIETGLFGRAYTQELEAIREDQHAKEVEYFTYHLGVREDDERNVPHDLRDVQPDTAVTSNLAPIASLVKDGKGDEDEITNGGSSLVESLIFYAHPFLTLASMVLAWLVGAVSPLLGLALFLGVQAVYAHVTLPLFGRNWAYMMRPTVKTAVSIGVLQVVLAALLPWWIAAPLLVLGNVAMLARPFMEGRQTSRGLGRRPLPVDGYRKPDFRNERERRAQQIEGAKDLSKNGPFITLGYATGKFRRMGHPFAPDRGAPMGGSVADLIKHIAAFGRPGSGKSFGLARPFAQQWMTLGTMKKKMIAGSLQEVWENCGGMFIMDKKAELGRDLIRDARKMSLDKFGIELIEIGTDDGCVPMAILEGLGATDVAQALAEISGEGKGGNPFFENSTYKWIQVSGTLLQGAIDVQTLRLDTVAQALKHPSTGASLGFKSYAHVVDTYKKAGKTMPAWMEAKFKREFIWIWPHLEDMSKDFIQDKWFLEGKVPTDSNGKEIKNFESHAPKMPAGGLVGLLKQLPYYTTRLEPVSRSLPHEEQKALNAQRAKGMMLDNAIKYATRFLPDMEPETRKNILATVGSWLDTASTSELLIPWLQLETGADVTACLRGAMVGLSLSGTEHKKAGMFFLDLAKRRFFNAILGRPENWRDDESQRPVLLEVDEAQGFLATGGGSEAPEAAILQMARSKGCVAFYLTQSYSEYDARLGHAAAKAFGGNFNSFISFDAENDTLEWARDRIGKHRTVEFKGLHAWNKVSHAYTLPVEVDDPKEMERVRAERAFATTYPTDVVLSEDDEKELADDGHKGHTALHMKAHLMRMFTLDLVLMSLPNAFGAVKADLALVKQWVKRQYHAVLRKGGAKTKASDEKAVHPVQFSARVIEESAEKGPIEPFFNSTKFGLLKDDFTCVASFKRGGSGVREDIMKAIKRLSVKQIRELAALQPGVVTVFDMLDRQGIAYDKNA
ncbi:TraM recognition domain-containing protein [Burkholderia anthina]|uniref:TraM recognition domain-containing protein n=1 Tax=Burkholderia anthina TaxID=179879 RepID=UPI0037C11584